MATIRIPNRKPASDQDRIIIRLPEGLHAKLKAAADETRQTMTQVAVSLMEQGLAKFEPANDKGFLLEKNADETLAALGKVLQQAEMAISSFQGYLLAEKKIEK